MDPKLREFQYKQLNFIINTNLLLKRKNIVESEKCESCQENETVYHLFYECPVVQTFWSSVSQFWSDIYLTKIDIEENKKLKLSKKDVILGNLKFCNILNYIIVLGKFFIFTSKNVEKRPLLNEFLVLLKDKYTIEENLAKKNNKIPSFRSRWSPSYRQLGRHR